MPDSAGVGRRLERLVARRFGADLPERARLPRYLAPLPAWLEDLGLRLAWPIVAINLLGTLFGFWYYAGRPLELAPPLIEGQLGAASVLAWPLIPDSPGATLFVALSLAAWRFDLEADPVHALAFYGCLKLGFWTPFVQLVVNGQGELAMWLYVFLIVSHLAMVLEAFLIHRYADFTVPAVAVALGWYGLNDLVDYFVPVFGGLHHTWLRAEPFVAGGIDHSVAAHDLAAACAVALTLLATFLALSTRVRKLEG